MKDVVGGRLPETDFGIVPMVLLFLALIMTAGRRLRHLKASAV